jgi:hypothetical protein
MLHKIDQFVHDLKFNAEFRALMCKVEGIRFRSTHPLAYYEHFGQDRRYVPARVFTRMRFHIMLQSAEQAIGT